MAIKFIAIKCPECGAELSVEEGREQAFCTYCGAKVMMTNENEHIYRHIDEAQIKRAEADIKQAETEGMIRLRELEMEERKRKAAGRMTGLKILVTILLVAIGVPVTGVGLIVIMGVFMNRADIEYSVFGYIALAVGVSILSSISFIWRRKK